MNCITLTEPWATLVAIGAKTIETRSWPAPAHAIGQPLAIHAAKGLTGRDLDWLEETTRAWIALDDFGWYDWPVFGDDRPKVKDAFSQTRGRVLATCRLAAWVPIPDNLYTDKRLWAGNAGEIPVTDDEWAFGNYLPGRWAWVLADVVRLPEPIPARGALGIWDWTQEGAIR
jgi:hypothetical protein